MVEHKVVRGPDEKQRMCDISNDRAHEVRRFECKDGEANKGPDKTADVRSGPKRDRSVDPVDIRIVGLAHMLLNNQAFNTLASGATIVSDSGEHPSGKHSGCPSQQAIVSHSRRERPRRPNKAERKTIDS